MQLWDLCRGSGFCSLQYNVKSLFKPTAASSGEEGVSFGSTGTQLLISPYLSNVTAVAKATSYDKEVGGWEPWERGA